MHLYFHSCNIITRMMNKECVKYPCAHNNNNFSQRYVFNMSTALDIKKMHKNQAIVNIVSMEL